MCCIQLLDHCKGITAVLIMAIWMDQLIHLLQGPYKLYHLVQSRFLKILDHYNTIYAIEKLPIRGKKTLSPSFCDCTDWFFFKHAKTKRRRRRCCHGIFTGVLWDVEQIVILEILATHKPDRQNITGIQISLRDSELSKTKHALAAAFQFCRGFEKKSERIPWTAQAVS